MSNKKKNIITFGGGVGAGKFLRGLYNFRSEYILKFVVNTSDDIDIYGLIENKGILNDWNDQNLKSR